ncbi:hypothetical protein H4R99_008585, partial [Coemansia sp. RSA 1722]
ALSHRTGSSGPPGLPLTDRLDLHVANTVTSDNHPDLQSTWAPTNPFGQQLASNTGLPSGMRRRASFDTLSVHEMAEVDRLNMHSRLHQLLSPHMAVGDQGMVSASNLSLAISPRLNATPGTPMNAASPAYTPSSKFSFTVPVPLPGIPGASSPAMGGRTPKPLPATPRRQSQINAMDGGNITDMQQSVFKFPPRQEMVEKSHPAVSPSPIFKDSVQESPGSKHSKASDKGKRTSMQPLDAPNAPNAPLVSRQEMAQRPFSGVDAGNAQQPVAAGSNPILVNTAQITTASQQQIPPIMSEQAIPTTQQQAYQQMPYTVPQQQIGDDSGLYKRPSLLQRLTSGWRKPGPVPCPPGQKPSQLGAIAEDSAVSGQFNGPVQTTGPIQAMGPVQSTNQHSSNPLKSAAGIAGISAAAGLFSKLFQPSAAAATKDEHSQVPMVDIVHSPEPAMQANYGGPNAANAYVSSGPQPYGVNNQSGQVPYERPQQQQQQQQQQLNSGSSMYPPPAQTHTQVPGFPNTVNSTTAHLP